MKGKNIGEFEELVLLCVRELGEDAHGVTIQELLALRAGRKATMGAIYSVLDRTERKGFSTSWLGEPTPVRGGRKKRHYGLTEAGLEALQASRRVRESFWSEAREVRP